MLPAFPQSSSDEASQPGRKMTSASVNDKHPESSSESPTQKQHVQQHQQDQHQHQQQSLLLQTSSSTEKQLSKLKRFLNTLVQFGSDISSETGQRVQHLVLNLVKGSLTIDKFRSDLQAATNFPLRPFVVPFLTANLPLMQDELLSCLRSAEGAGKSRDQLLMKLLRDCDEEKTAAKTAVAGTAVTTDDGGLPQKRHFNDSERSQTQDATPSPKKRQFVSLPRNSCGNGSGYGNGNGSGVGNENGNGSGSGNVNGSGNGSGNGVGNVNGNGNGNGSGASGGGNAGSTRFVQPHHPYVQPLVEGAAATENGVATVASITEPPQLLKDWKQVETTLSTIVELIDKVRKSMASIQQQQQQHQQSNATLHYSQQSPSQMMPASSESSSVARDQIGTKRYRFQHQHQHQHQQQKQHVDSLLAEVRRQTQREAQIAVALAEERASKLLAMEKLRSEQLLAQAREEAAAALRMQNSSVENCWNCGRLASETCSGCGAARYCGSFCQHKDWERHQKACGTRQIQMKKDSFNCAGQQQQQRQQKSGQTVATSSKLSS